MACRQHGSTHSYAHRVYVFSYSSGSCEQRATCHQSNFWQPGLQGQCHTGDRGAGHVSCTLEREHTLTEAVRVPARLSPWRGIGWQGMFPPSINEHEISYLQLFEFTGLLRPRKKLTSDIVIARTRWSSPTYTSWSAVDATVYDCRGRRTDLNMEGANITWVLTFILAYI